MKSKFIIAAVLIVLTGSTAVCTAPDGKIKLLKYTAAVESALREKLCADVGYFWVNLQESEP